MKHRVALLTLIFGGALGCASGETTGDEGTGGAGQAGQSGAAGATGLAGATGAAGTPGNGGTTGVAGSDAAGGAGGPGGQSGDGAGGAGPGGVAGTAGRGGGSAGTSGGASGNAAAGKGGAGGGSAGNAGTTGTAGAGGGSAATAVPSAGCAKAAGRPSGGKVTVTNDHIYDFPTSYDGTKPFPLLIGFHAAGNPIDQIEGLTNNTSFATNYVRAFPKSAGNEWIYNTDLASKAYKVYDDLMANYCIDTSRVFATGHSSGAQMIVQILVHADAAKHMNFKAVAPVAASDYGAITVPIPVMYIQGKMDMVRNGDGHETVARFTKANGCGTTTTSYAGAMTCTSGSTSVNPGCVSYQGCTAPTVWCSHNDPQYSNTNHGWPCFAAKAMYDFFAALP